jgi:hypothetical protein
VEDSILSFSLPTRTVLAAALVAVAVLLTLTGFDVLRWRGQFEHGQVALEARSADPTVWEPETVLPHGVSKWVLGAGEQVSYARAVQQYELHTARAALDFSRTRSSPELNSRSWSSGRGTILLSTAPMRSRCTACSCTEA